MQLEEMFQSMIHQANAKIVYGEPVSAGSKTILPVASICYGFGGGSGRKASQSEEGSGGGAGLAGKPVGVVEITAEHTRFIPINPNRTIAMAAGLGFCLGMLVARGRRKYR